MATKFGEGYYEIYPKINRAAVNAARAAITKGLGDEFARTQAKMRNEDDATTRSRLNNEEKVRRTHSRNTTGMGREETALGRLRSDLNKRLQKEAKDNEGAFHRLATQFRTIGTIIRGLSVGGVVLGAFNGIRIALGGIAAAIPAINAGLVATPSLLASVGAEALILKIAFHGVGSAISDAFNPKKQKQYNEELKKLAPAARSFVQEIAKLGHMRLPNLQQTFFSQGGVQKTGRQLAPLVRGLAPGANRVAAASGGLLGGIGASLTGNKGLAAFNQVLRSLALTLKAVTPGFKHFTDGLLELIGHVSALGTGKLGKSFSDWLTKIGKFLSQIDVAKAFAKGKDALHGLLSVGSDLFDIIKKIFNALNTKDAFGSFTAIIHSIRQFVDSGAGQKFLSQLGSALSIVSSLASSLTGSFLKLLSSAFAQLYPSIKPLADVISKIGKDLVPLGPVIGAIGARFAEIATNVGNVLEPAIKAVVGFLVDHKSDVVDAAVAIGGIMLAFKAVGVITKFASAIKGLMLGYRLLTGAVLASNAAEEANPIGLIIIAVAALAFAIYELVKHWKTVWGVIKQVSLDVWHAIHDNVVAPIVNFFTKTIPHAFNTALDWVKKNWPLIVGFLVNPIGTAIYLIISKVTPLRNFFTKTVPSWFLKLRDWIVYAYNLIVNWTHERWSKIINFFTGTVKNFFIKTIPGWFLKLRDWVLYAYNLIVNWTHSKWSSVINFFTGTVKNFFTKTIPGWFLKFRDWVVYAYNAVKDKTVGFINNTIIGNFNKLKNFFTKTVPGWLNTFKTLAVNAIKNAANGIWTAWTKVANFLWTPVSFVVKTVYDNGLRKFWNATVGKIPGIGKKLSMPYVSMPAKAPFRTGGHVRGPGGPESDQIDARLSNNEYVIKASKVKKYGVRFFDSLNYGPDHTGDGSSPRGFNLFNVGYKGGGAVASIPDRVSATLGWLKSIANRVPYVLGANGPNAFDCSSLVGNVWARLTNNPINRRYFVTGTENAWAAHHGFSKGADPSGFTIGTNGEHTTGILAGHRFEAAHTGTKMRFDDGAMAATKFPSVWHMTGLTGLGGGIGYDPIIDKVLKGGLKGILGPAGYLGQVWKDIKKIPHPGVDKDAANLPKEAASGAANLVGHNLFSLADKAKKLALKAMQNLGKSFGNLINNKSLTSTVGTALAAAGAPSTWMGDVLKIIRGESGGNANAQNNSDINAQRGDPSQGLMQLTHSNFEHYRSKKLPNDPFNPLANVYAGIKYIQSRYGDIKYTPWISGKGRYYGSGGLVPTLFDSGGYLPPKSMTLAANNTSNWERVGGGMPSKIVLDLGNNKTIEFMMDDRIAKYEDEIIKYSATR